MPTWNNDTESNLLVLVAEDGEKGTRLDQFVATNADLTRSAAVRLIEDGAVTVNGKTVAKNYKVGKGDTVEVTLPEPEAAEALPENIPLDIIFEDDDIIVVNKPVGMVVHTFSCSGPRSKGAKSLLSSLYLQDSSPHSGRASGHICLCELVHFSQDVCVCVCVYTCTRIGACIGICICEYVDVCVHISVQYKHKPLCLHAHVHSEPPSP